jgi:hypothetical protein
LDYPAHVDVRRVNSNGHFRWRGGWIWLTKALVGEDIALEPLTDDVWTIAFGPLVLGTLELPGYTFTPETYWKFSEQVKPSR